MAMSKELNGGRGYFSGVPGPSSTSTGTQTDEWLLTRVASRVHPDAWKLKHFALLLEIDDDTYCKIQQQAEATGQGIPLNVSGFLSVPCNSTKNSTITARFENVK